MNKKIIILLLLLPVFFTGCSMFINKDTTGNVSMISYKPVMKLVGDPIMSLKAGSSYTEQGVEAYAGDTLLDYEIVSGKVKPDSIGFYVVTYKATNGFGWSSYSYRAVLVHDGTPYEGDISGTYKKGFLFKSTIQKYSIDGYYQIDNVWQQQGTVIPIIFADMGDGVNFGIVPGENELGFYSGTVKRNGSVLTFNIHLVTSDSNVYDYQFEWTKQ